MKKWMYRFLFMFAGILFLNMPAFPDDVPDLAELRGFEIDGFLSRIGEQNADSNRLNTLGFYAYQEGNLEEAAKLWRCAVDRDAQNAWAHYNLACAYALFAESFGRDPADVVPELEWGDPEVDLLMEFTDLVLFHLKQAVLNNMEIWSRMQEDQDLNLIRNMNAYRLILLYPENNSAKLLEIISTWYEPNHGVYPGGVLSFHDDTVTIEKLVFDEQFNPVTVIETGSYTIEGNQLLIEIQQPGRRLLHGELVVDYDEFGFIRSYYLRIDGTTYSSTPDYSA